MDQLPLVVWNVHTKHIGISFRRSMRFTRLRFRRISNGHLENPNITLYAFDGLILVCGERLKRSGLKLLDEAKQWDMPVLLVINQYDRSIEGEKRKEIALKNRSLTENKYRELLNTTIHRIRTRVQEQLNRSDEIGIFCVSALTEHLFRQKLQVSMANMMKKLCAKNAFTLNLLSNVDFRNNPAFSLVTHPSFKPDHFSKQFILFILYKQINNEYRRRNILLIRSA